MNPERDSQTSDGAWQHRILVLAVLFLSSLAIFGRLGDRSFENKDISRTAEIARETVAHGRWLAPTCEGELEIEKPPLYVWLVAAIGTVTGRVGPTESRLPSALSSFASVVLVVAWTARRRGLEAGVRAGALLATGELFVLLARVSRVDSTFAFFITLSILLAFEARGGRWGRTLAFSAGSGCALGLAVLTKGPLAVILHLGVVVGFIVLETILRTRNGDGEPQSDSRRSWHRELMAPSVVLPVLVSCMVLAMWLVPFWLSLTSVERTAYWNQFYYENVLRGAGQAEKAHSVAYYLPLVTSQAAPGFFLALVPLVLLCRKARALEDRHFLAFATAWWIFPFVLLSLSAGKQVRYLLPCLPGIAVAGSEGWRLLAESPHSLVARTWFVAGWLTVAVGGIAALGLPLVAALAAPELLGDALWIAIGAGAACLAALSFTRGGRKCDVLWPLLVLVSLGEIAFFVVYEPSQRHDKPRAWVRQLATEIDPSWRLADIIVFQPRRPEERKPRHRQLRLLLSIYRDDPTLPLIAEDGEHLLQLLRDPKRAALIERADRDLAAPALGRVRIEREIRIRSEGGERDYIFVRGIGP